jgi:hypothetical protein
MFEKGVLLIDIEAVVNFSMLIIQLVGSILFVVIKGKGSKQRKVLLLQALGFGFGLFIIASLVAFFVYTDSLNILVFWIIYLLVFIVTALVNIAIIFLRKR